MKTPEKKHYSFSYKLSYGEAYEAFKLLASPMRKQVKILISAVLTFIAVALLIGYFRDSQKVHYFFIAVIAILMLFYEIYYPELKARQGAGNVAKTNGLYKLTITSDGNIQLPKSDKLPLKSDKDARAIETAELFVIRTDRVHTFCIPKRIVNEGDLEGLRMILKSYLKYVQR